MFSKLRKLFWQMVSRFRHDDAGHAPLIMKVHDHPSEGVRRHASEGHARPQPEQVPSHGQEPEAKIDPQAELTAPAPDPSDAPAAASAQGEEVGGGSVPESPARVGGAGEAEPSAPAENRHQRRSRRKALKRETAEIRRYERARLKYDKWVTPAGPLPVERMRAAPQPKIDKSELVETQPESLPEVEDAHAWLVDKLHYDEKVLVDENELYGTFNFRDTILDQLDKYWFYLERMRKKDADAYGFYKRVGATLVPHVMPRMYDATGEKVKRSKEVTEDARSEIRLPAQFRTKRPGFGCVVWGCNSVVEQHEERIDRSFPRFMYFVKYDRHKMPPEIQPVAGDGDVYKMVVYFDSHLSRKKKYFRKTGIPCEFAVFVDRTGTQIRALRILNTKIITIPKKHSSWETYKIPRRAWYIPEFYKDWANEHGLSASLHMEVLFCDAMRQIERTNYAMLRVAVHKRTGDDDTVAVFGIEPARTSYFFRDRDYQLTESGLRKPVFHFVRPHLRADGSAVKAHFRGEREFDWAGYHVKITVPGLDHFMMPEVNIPCHDDYWREKKDKVLYEPEFAKLLADWMDQGIGGHER